MRQPYQGTPAAGNAVLHLKGGSTYVGHVVYDGRLVTVTGRRRVKSLIGGEQTHTYRAPRQRSWPVHLVREIEWEDEHADRAEV
jgi:hypothetical protein